MDLDKKARAHIMIKHPFFATLVMSMESVQDYNIPTACTDGKTIRYNPDFLESLDSVEVVMSVIAHEAFHPMLGWFERLGHRDPRLWNVAHDFKVNQILEESGFTLGPGWLRDSQYDSWSADQIYDSLKQQAEDQRKGGNSGKPGEGGMPGTDSLHGDEGDLRDPPNFASSAEQAKFKQEIKQRLAQAASVGRMSGKLPGSLERLIGDILDPQVPWQHMLLEYVTRRTHDDESWTRRNRRYSDIYLPSRWSQRMGEIIEIGDTSGSIGNDELCRYAAEGQEIIRAVNPERTRLIWADTRVAGEQLFEEGDPFLPVPKGGGGTDMRVPLKYAEQYEPEVVILFTDGYTPWPDAEPPYPLIICCTTDAACPDYANVVRVK